MILKLKLRSCFFAALGGLILAFGLYNVHSLSGVTEGGVLGLCLLFEHHLRISPAVSGLILNAICYFIGWRSLGRDFIGYSVFAAGSFSLFYAIFESFPPLFPKIADFPLLAAVCGAVFVGVGVGISVRAGGAPSGDDALAMSLSHLMRVDIKWTYLISDLIVLLLSLTYIPLPKVLYSLVSVILSGQIIDLVQKIRRRDSDETPSDMRDVLCATLRSADQLETCLEKRFYHIPAIRLNSGDFPLHYIALYQSPRTFEASGIIYYGEIERYALVKRCDITEIPKDSVEMYYRFDIKEWRRLPSAISADIPDFVNMTTSLFLLTNATKTSELFLATREEFSLYWRIEKLISGEINEILSSSDRGTIRIANGILLISRKGKPDFSCAVADYVANPISAFRYISREFKA